MYVPYVYVGMYMYNIRQSGVIEFLLRKSLPPVVQAAARYTL